MRCGRAPPQWCLYIYQYYVTVCWLCNHPVWTCRSDRLWQTHASSKPLCRSRARGYHSRNSRAHRRQQVSSQGWWSCSEPCQVLMVTQSRSILCQYPPRHPCRSCTSCTTIGQDQGNQIQRWHQLLYLTQIGVYHSTRLYCFPAYLFPNFSKDLMKPPWWSLPPHRYIPRPHLIRFLHFQTYK